MKTILAPVDLSDVTKRVVAEAATLARSLAGRVVLLNVTPPVVVVGDYTASRERIAEIADVNAKAAAKQLAEMVDELRRDSTKADSMQLTGAPVPLIVAQAQKLRAAYIVIGSHGHTAFYDLLVGSTASGILKRSPCPVVVVPPRRKKPAKAGR